MARKYLTIGIIFLFLFCNISFTTLSDENSGNSGIKTLYVGGSGPGNYTKIQDAIEDASDGDTVFVYSGTYYLGVGFTKINKSIELMGESRDETIITGYPLFSIVKSNVRISGFTFENCVLYCIPDIFFDGLEDVYNIEISNNRIHSEIGGLLIYFCNNVTVNGNIFSSINNEIDNEETPGVLSFLNTNVKIENNKISGFYRGIICSNGDVVKNNLICDNEIGIQLWAYTSNSSPCIIRNNNFVNNKIHASFELCCTSDYPKYVSTICKYDWIKDCKLKDNQVPKNKLLSRNFYWYENYWDNWIGFGPKLISGRLILLDLPSPVTIPWFNFDWHPAKEPYDIQVPEV
ncbi:MAG: hypothetical protein JXA91_06305 [Candidatus Thermoplasmatota archaeon]|nr:hypothetical protein [Candidatus Thermoplasmatota archaeon]